MAVYESLFQQAMTHENPMLQTTLHHLSQRLGKRMRPILVILSARMVGQFNQRVAHAALALELLHTASLVHDDIVDESDRRRGQASVNARFGNKVAVLVGDWVLSMALQHAALTQSTHVVELVARLGQTLADGELQQLHNTQTDLIDEKSYYAVVRKKTASLFAACAQIGALLGGAGKEDVERMRQIGQMAGTCFQLRDDIFDYDDTHDVGKPAGNDMREGKLTLPVIHAVLHGGDESMRQLALDVRCQRATEQDIRRLVEYTRQQDGIAYAQWAMQELMVMADGLVPDKHNPGIAAALHTYIKFMAGRES